jgi:glycosyltransferase involved in cell wall biosynthesis
MVKINAFILCQDEITHLPRLLDTLDKFVDDIYIVDGGSKDGTIEYLRERGVKLFERKWSNSFGEQRNFLLDKVPDNSWIFWIDCDELPTLELVKNIRSALEIAEKRNAIDLFKDNTFGFYIENYNLVQDENHYDASDKNLLGRIFYKTKHLRFTDTPVHTTPLPEMKGFALPNTMAIVHFAGLDKQSILNKIEKYKKIGNEQDVKNYNLLNNYGSYKIEPLPEYIKI